MTNKLTTVQLSKNKYLDNSCGLKFTYFSIIFFFEKNVLELYILNNLCFAVKELFCQKTVVTALMKSQK